MISKWIATLFILAILPGFAQDRKILSGRVIAAGNPVSGLFIINKNTGAEVKSGADGLFSIPAAENDRITVYSPNIQVREFAVTANSFTHSPYILEAESTPAELDEVVINQVSSESLGLVPKGQKQHTQIERKLYTTGEFKPVMLLGLLVGSMPLDPLINAINGRTNRVRKELQIERKQMLSQQINELFTDDELVGFGLPADTARGFIYYLVEDSRVGDALKTGNTEMVRLLLAELADKYTKLQQP